MCLYSSKRVERRVWQGPVMILHVPCLLLQKILCFPSLCFQNRDRPFQGVIVCCGSVRKELLSDSRSDREDLHCEILMTSCHGGRIHWASAAGKVHSWSVLQAAFELWSAPLSVIVPQYATAAPSCWFRSSLGAMTGNLRVHTDIVKCLKPTSKDSKKNEN